MLDAVVCHRKDSVDNALGRVVDALPGLVSTAVADGEGREVEHRYRAIVDGLPAIVTLLSTDGHVVHANRHMLEYLGTKAEDMQARAIGQAFHPDDRSEVLVRWQHSARTGEPYDFEARLRRADGVYRWFHTRGFPLRDASATIVLWYFLQTDIDDRKRAENLLAGEKRLLEMVARGDARLDVLNELCHLVESAAGDCYCSVVLADPTGARVEHGAAPSLPATFIDAIIGRAINTETGPCGMAAFLNQEVISIDLSSEPRWRTWCPMALDHGLRACWSTPIVSSSGRVLGAFAIYHESPTTPTAFLQGLIGRFTHIASIAVSRVQSDDALNRSEAFLVEAQRLSLTGSFSWRVSTDDISWSEQVYRIFGCEQGVPVTFALIESRVHPDDLWLLREMIERSRAGVTHYEYEHRLLMPDQSITYLRLIARGRRDQNGQLEYIGAVQDVTDARVAEEALGRARSELAQVGRAMSLGVLTASIAHEVNQPLSGIMTNAGTCLRMLAPDPPNVDGARETARRTIRDANRASEVITRLRALFTKGATTTDEVDLNQLARDVIALSARELQQGRVLLSTDFTEHLPAATGDRVQLQQVILNLLLNAADSMNAVDDRPRQLVIRTAADNEGRVCLSVIDNGIGLATRNPDELFDAFYTTKQRGMGIGLSVSRTIIESHQGRIWASRNSGPGATFAFSLPRSSGDCMAPVAS